MIQFIKQVNRKRIKHVIFKKLKLRFFGKAIYSSIVTLNDGLEEQVNLKI